MPDKVVWDDKHVGHHAESPWATKSGPARKLRVLVDRDTVPQDDQSLFEMLLGRDSIEAIQFSDDGPPPDAQTLDTELFGSAALGWVTLGPPERATDDPFAGRILKMAHGSTLHTQKLLASSTEFLGLTTADFAEGSLTEKDATLYAVAQDMDADLLVTGRQRLTESPLSNGKTPIRTSAAAVPLLGLYLRSADDLVTAVSPRVTEEATPLSTYFETIVATYCPSLVALADHHADHKRFDLSILLDAAQRKLGSALAGRDRVWRHTMQHPSPAQLNEIADDFDIALVQLTSALDAVSQYTDVSLSLGTHKTAIGFQRRHWRAAVASASRYEFGEDEVVGARAVTGLRNFIHAGGKRSVPVDVGSHQWKRTTTYLVHEWEAPAENGTLPDPADALYELASGAFRTPASDIGRLPNTDHILIAPGPALDTLTGAVICLTERMLAHLATLIGLEPVKEPGSLRIRPEIRREQALRLLAIPGFANVEYLA